MIDKREIINLAAQMSLTPHVVEKDYVLGWMLAGIYAHEELAESWIFKGGTCLKKCFFETYRFSEDLDFTLRNEAHIDETFLKRVFAEVGTWVYDETGICLTWRSLLSSAPMESITELSRTAHTVSRRFGGAAIEAGRLVSFAARMTSCVPSNASALSPFEPLSTGLKPKSAQ